MTKGRLALIGLVPALILLAGQLGACRVASRPEASSRARLEAQATVIGSKLDALLAEALAAAKLAQDGAPEAVSAGLPPVLSRRLEGAATLRSGRFETWSGTPAEAEFFGEPGSARVISRGLRTSLLVRSEADAKGRSGVASFMLTAVLVALGFLLSLGLPTLLARGKPDRPVPVATLASSAGSQPQARS